MDAVFVVLLFAHLVGLMLVAAAFLGLLGRMPRAAEPGAAVEAFGSRFLTSLGHIGIIVLLVSGPLMIWVRYGGFGGISHWFWVKMVLVVVLAGGIVLAAASSRRARKGEADAMARVRLGRIIAAASLFGVVLAAVLAFG